MMGRVGGNSSPPATSKQASKKPTQIRVNVCNFAGLGLLAMLWLGLSHLNEHRFSHNFENLY